MLVVLTFTFLIFTGGVLGSKKPCDTEPTCPKRQHYTVNDTRCIRTCANRMVPRSRDCKPFTGCVCDHGLVRLEDDGTGPCVSEDKCRNKCSDPHAVYKNCPNPCPLTCSHPNPRPCAKLCLKSGCECAPGFVLNEITGKCIRQKNCPGKRCKDRNAIYKKCPNPCPLTCAHPKPRPCNKKCHKRGCECAPGFIINDITRKCIRPKDCPVRIRCPKHSHYVINDQECQKTCGNRLLPNRDAAGACKPFTGCVCNHGYVRKYDNATGPCIPKRKCPPIPTQCGINEQPTSCRIFCSPQTCESIFTSYNCLPTECEPGCDCLDGYLRNSDEICIPSEDCFEPDDTSGCYGDVNATLVECGSSCPATCAEPDTGNEACDMDCALNACQCNPGYILSEPEGVCIKPEDCPGGSPICGANQTYAGCKMGCPTDFCPVDDSRAQVACSMPNPCPGGCVCNKGYLVVSRDDRRCVLASECPKVKCTRKNEVWNPKPSSCFLEKCEDRDHICEHQYPTPPRCVCKKGFYRDENDNCVPASKCPPLGCDGDRNATLKECPSACPLTCADQDPNKPCIAICLPKGCECNPGYVLTEKGGQCIKPQDCPVQPGCNGDPNAIFSTCPSACQATCENQDTNQPCIKKCMPRGCVCKPGYILTEKGGKCIKPETCPELGCNGDRNATLKECPSACPLTCADQDPNKPCIAICLPKDCECNPGYVLTEKGGKCIKPQDCPVQPGCNGDPNAIFSTCPSACQATCDNPDTNQLCNKKCMPRGCVCKPGYILTEKGGKCIKPETCPELGCNGDRNATLKECPSACPLTCADQDPNKPCIAICLPKDCECNPGYVLTDKGGKCIKPQDCPVQPGCNGDPNAIFSTCPSACQATCDNPDTNQLCNKKCMPRGCVCKPGYILTEKGGKCIKPETCPELGCNGDRNATLKECPSACPLTCADQEPNKPCTALCLRKGCECNPGYVLTDIGGKCIKPQDCPVEPGCNGDPNAIFSTCPSACQATCDNPDTNQLCNKKCMPRGCVCKPGYILTEKGGKCIKPETCPELGCNGDRNATLKECPNACPLTCADQEPNKPCTALCLRKGCECNPGYVLTDIGGKCIKPQDCPGCNGDPNAIHSDCPSYCPPTCADRNKKNENVLCPAVCDPSGCVCKPGFILTEKGGRCVKPENCPAEPQCNGDRNATYKECTSPCQATCDEPDTDVPCIDKCMPAGCVCKQGYLKNKTGGQCVKPEDCPGGSPTCRGNKTYVYCKVGCPNNYCPRDDSLARVACDPIRPCPGGCACKKGYLLRREDDTCILSSECPPVECTRPNEVYNPNTPGCLRESCNNRNIPCDYQYPGAPRCVCIEGYFRNQDEICVPESQCPPVGCDGDRNATLKECPSACPLTCADQDPNKPCIAICLPKGCECNPGYVLTDKGGQCIKPQDCPVQPGCNGDPNAIFSTCPSACQATCEKPDTNQPCNKKCMPRGCVCKPGYILTEKGGKCIKPETCPELGCNGDRNATLKECPSACPLTCADQDPNKPCIEICLPKGCECNPGYVLTEKGGKCIKPQDCPAEPQCNGDRNATYKECTSPCQATCDEPDTDVPCIDKCMPAGCVCKQGYLKNKTGGQCVKPEDCPGGSPTCRGNKTYVYCKSGCPTDYCPRDDSLAMIACDPIFPCPGGCACKRGYLLRSEDDTCILSSECPPIECTRPNEVYNPNTPGCLRESCNNRNIPCDYQYPGPPRCVCIEGYFRNQDEICVPESQCPRTECDDPNATFSDCPPACPATCNDPDSDRPCITACAEPGCVCNEGFILSEPGGVCIRPYDCPGGSPICGANQTYAGCKIGCPTNFCPADDSRAQVACSMPYPCRGGCVCNASYLILSRDDRRCVLASECPKVNCTRKNEVWNPKPSSCFLERCEDRDNICEHQYQSPPRCVCEKGFYRNESDDCVPASKCPPLGCDGDRNATLKECPSACPLTCADQDPNKPCIAICLPKGCECNPGYVLTDKGGQCIKPQDCPVQPGCNGDPNAIFSTCPSACQATCEKPDTNQPCNKKCMPRGCVCKPGYILTEKGGKCIKPETCPELGCNGDRNATLKECPSACPLTCADQDPNKPCIEICLPKGCECNPGYVLTEKGGKCIKSQDCPGCNGDPNAIHNDCPSYCPPTCADRNKKNKNVLCPDVCDPSGCVCKPGYILTEKGGRCVKPENCPEPGCYGDPNAMYSECPSACQPTCAKPDNNQPCIQVCLPSGCVCKPGFVLTENGKCIKPESCPAEPQCNGDRNATYKECPSPCQATCDEPDTDGPCIDMCMPDGCVCKQGYLLNKTGGQCIKPEDCPGGSPTCRGNKTYVYCKSGCPSDYCPRDDSLAIFACDPIYPCRGGCACKGGYLLRSEEDDTCILSSECPPLECTRPNEVYNPNTPGCLRESCNNRNIPCDYQYPGPPRCVCIEGYFRNQDEICVPESQCPRTECDDPNATYSDCPPACPATCSDPDSDRPCIAVACAEPGCVCNEGFILSEPGGVCIRPYDCPGGSPICTGNKTYSYCKSGCPTDYCTRDDSPFIIACAPVYPCRGGCVCKEGYLLHSEEDETCILSSECPPVECTRPNEVWNPYTPGCLRESCYNRNIPCDYQYPGAPRCVCIEGYFRNQYEICVPESQCPRTECDDPNATFSDCPSACPATCNDPDSDRPCITACAEPGCVCNEGFILSGPGGVCIRPNDCPGGSPDCSENMTYSGCKIDCPMRYCPAEENEIMRMCDPVWPCPSGCVCKPGYLMLNSNDRTCILAADCPPVECTGPNQVWDPSPSSCNFERCDEMYYTCDDPNPGRPKCVCKEGYYKDQDGVCIPAEECPKSKCGYNEVAVPCRQICPPQNCEIAYTDYACTEESEILCEPGCDCLPDHLRNGSGICILNELCPYPSTPVCGINEVARDCRRICPPQSCESKYTLYSCIQNLPCEPGCDCVPNYLRDERGICIRSEQCPEPCPIFDECKQTCRNPNPPNCEYAPPPKDNINGCNCKDGYILSELGGDCIPIEDCPTDIGCNGDPNASIKQCPYPCSSTCEAPNAFPCKRKCDAIGCECNPGYLLSNETGQCVLPDKCPGGNPCGKHGRFVDCKVDCPNDYCPVDDSRGIVFCDPPAGPCLSGCVCKLNHKMKSREDPRCIMSSDCPPVKCTRPKEKWSPCPSACLAENCEDVNNQPTTCNPLVLNCEPACICKKNHFRNSSGICIPAKDCPCQVRDECKRTCGNPNPPNCEYAPPPKDNIKGCDCKDGYILSELGGDCIPIEDCPTEIGCNGDPNASIKQCPNPCPSTCEAPNAFSCERKCDAIGCECNSGYLLSNKTGRCVLPDKCPGGNPCGKHGRFVDCKVECPTDYCPVDDSRGIVICDPPVGSCLSGCVCNLNHKKKSREDPRCIMSSDCPPVKCTRPNEEWSPCPSPCRAENCEDVNNQPTTCNTLVLNCEPACICKKNHFRNSSGICIPAKDCPCQVRDECKRTCRNPNPPNCEYAPPPKDNIKGCDCKDGYILSELGGDCIPIEDCPTDIGCNGDPNASIKQCPHPCPSTCESPNAFPCKRKCDAIGCECNPGYLLSNETGRCVLPDKCPGGNPCGKHGRFVDCKVECPTDYCPVDDSRGIVICDPPVGSCLSGCICKLNHKIKSREDPRCIMSSDCPPVKCTRPKEKWSPCPSACLAENCEDVNNQPTTCNPLVLNCEPACICKKNHFRNSSGICIPAKDCPCQVRDECKRTCRNPNPPNCEYAPPPKDNIKGCDCKDGYILSELGGDCIPIEDCPTDIGCNGDPNASIKQCPHPCPSTCEAPNAFPCKRKCDPIGCECNPGYLLSNETGRCILPDKCPAGNPCGECGQFVDCKMDCSNDYCPVDDSRGLVSCDLPADPCLSGCVCKLNHKMKSREDPRCIMSSKCPPVKCTRPNEKWSSCPSPCRAENCKDVNNQPTTCNTLVENCEPACICKKNHFRNSSGICIPAKDCPC